MSGERPGATFKAGDVVELEHTTDQRTRLTPGTHGTVAFVDSLGTVHVTWKDGHTLGMVLAAGDRIRLIHRPESSPPASHD
jgi:Domain of unknown function (DUF4314)